MTDHDRPRGRRWIGAMMVAAATLFSGAGNAEPQTAELTAADRADIARAETWLNAMRTLESHFVQTTSQGGIAEGTIYLQRPGRMRIDYQPPTPLQLFADGTWLIYLDRELKQVNQVPLNATPAAFLVRDEIRFSGDITVDRVERRRGTLLLHLTQTGEADAGRLIVTLAAEPLSLRGWTVIDAQGIETTVTLIGPSVNREIEKSVLTYTPPDWAFPSPD